MAEKMKTAHEDTFVLDSLPPVDEWPEMDFSGVPELSYPEKLNCGVELLDRMVERGHGSRPVLHFNGRIWTYKDLKTKADQVARVLAEDMNLKPGNRVLLRSPNNPMMVACWFGIVKAGGVVVATMPLLRAKELSYIIDKADILHGLCDVALSEEFEESRSQVSRLEHFRYFSNDGERNKDLEQAMAGKPAGFENVQTFSSDPVLIAFTSGTTGAAKGTIHFHRDVLAICDTFARYVNVVSPEDIYLGSPPLAFTFGLGALVTFPMRFGASTVMVEQFGPTTMLETIQEYGVTGLYTAPTAYRAMTGLVAEYDLSSLKSCVSAGEHIPLPTWQDWKDATGIKIIDGIGATEMLHIFISASGDEIRPGATGKAIPGYQARIVDENGDEIPIGEEGWLAVKGPTGCRYLDNPERQEKYVRKGWNITGDIFSQDEDGYFWYVARGDDMIISSGYNISGPEVETSLLAHPKVAECAVVGFPDEERGHIVKAYVVVRNPVDKTDAVIRELQDFVKADIAPYKYPRAIAFLDELPKTQTGKLQRFRLREQASPS